MQIGIVGFIAGNQLDPVLHQLAYGGVTDLLSGRQITDDLHGSPFGHKKAHDPFGWQALGC